ncbi:MAG TPA: HNH endonuclease signature motif containing protein [Gemmataceae bacterium]|jgi:5-methylcytosine-specific restriction endonuclease McrA|nr:HNH endonuclease signature motif containing protein [Gemmataceae bacterium]
MDEALVALVRVRAGSRCEYCRVPADFHPWQFEVEHVVAWQHGGQTRLGNLAYACLQCNRHKGPNLASIDRITSLRRDRNWCGCSTHDNTGGHFISPGMAV